MAITLKQNIPAKQLADILLELCDIPNSFFYTTTEEKIELTISAESLKERVLIRAELQERLRKRFNQPERKKYNQRIIK